MLRNNCRCKLQSHCYGTTSTCYATILGVRFSRYMLQRKLRTANVQPRVMYQLGAQISNYMLWTNWECQVVTTCCGTTGTCNFSHTCCVQNRTAHPPHQNLDRRFFLKTTVGKTRSVFNTLEHAQHLELWQAAGFHRFSNAIPHRQSRIALYAPGRGNVTIKGSMTLNLTWCPPLQPGCFDETDWIFHAAAMLCFSFAPALCNMCGPRVRAAAGPTIVCVLVPCCVFPLPLPFQSKAGNMRGPRVRAGTGSTILPVGATLHCSFALVLPVTACVMCGPRVCAGAS